MRKKYNDYLKITDLKDMLNKTRNLYTDKPAYKLKISEGEKLEIILIV